MMNIDWLIGTSEARINHFLRKNAIETPAELQDTVIKITLPEIPMGLRPEVYCHLYAKRILLSQQSSQKDVAIQIDKSALAGLAKGDKLAALLLEKKIEMQGDIGKAHALQHWLESLALSKEDVFSEIFGDTLSPLLLSLEKQAQPFIASTFELGKNIVNQFSDKLNMGKTDNDDSTAIKQQLLKLREQTERLEARMQQLSEQLNQQKH